MKQTELAKLWSVIGGTLFTTPCPQCHPQNRTRTKNNTWQRGFCGELVAVRCTTCGYIRASRKRKAPRTHGLTLAQQKAIARVGKAIRNMDSYDGEIHVELKDPHPNGSVIAIITWQKPLSMTTLTLGDRGAIYIRGFYRGSTPQSLAGNRLAYLCKAVDKQNPR